MKYPIYSYRDHKVGFMPPQCDQSEQAAVRGFAYAINGKDGIMHFSPSDFDLYHVGDFDSESGQIVAFVPELVCSGSSISEVK